LLSLPQETSSLPGEKRRKQSSLAARKSKLDNSSSSNTHIHATVGTTAPVFVKGP
jgi:hypothetical protein